jgi:cobalt-zinc-cadmium resistance protein CzcA
MSWLGRLINGVISASLRRPWIVIGATVVVFGAGVWAFATLNTDAFPDLTPNQVLVMTEAPGLTQVEVEQQVTYPMETAMLGLPRTTGVRSISKVGLSVVTVTFEDDVDFYFARAQVQQRMQDAAMKMPSGVQPMLGPPATAMGEAFQYLVEPVGDARDTLTLIDLSNIQQYLIEPLLRTVPGVAEVNAWGGMPQRFEVLLDPARLPGYAITVADIKAALANNNTNFGAGYIEERGERLSIRGIGRVSSARDIGDIVVANRNGTPVYVHDVARVIIAPQLRYGAVSRDGKGEALSAAVLILKGSNSRDVVTRVGKRLQEIVPLLPKGVRVRPFYDQSLVVQRTSRTVFRNLIEGALLVIAVLFLFLRNIRASLLTASVIPLSLMAAFLLMKRFGVTANLMSLGALDFGLIVDATVVMVENSIRRLNASSEGEDKAGLLAVAAFEVARPIVFGVCIIVAVYIPIFSLQGLEGRMFRPMAFTVCAAVLVSLVFALTYVPAMSSSVLRKESNPGRHGEEPGWYAAIRAFYLRRFDWALLNTRKIVVGALVIFVVAIGSLPFLGTEFMPKLDEGSLLIETRRAPSTSLPQGLAVSNDVERTLLGFPEVASVVTNLGRPHQATEVMALNQADVYVNFKPRSEWHNKSVDALIQRMDSALSEIPGLDYDFSAPMRMRLDEVISGVKTDLGIKVYGDSLPLLQEKAEQIKNLVDKVSGAKDVSVGVSAGALQLEIDLDRETIARYGLNIADVKDVIESAVSGAEATEVLEGRRRYPVVVRLDASYRTTAEDVRRIPIATPAGGVVTLAQLARIREVEVPEVVNHEATQRYVVVQSNVRGRDLGGFARDVRKAVEANVKLPSGYYVAYSGQFENQARATRRLGLIVPLVLALIAVLLYAALGSARHALLVMLNVPFALVGGIAALWLRGIHLNLSASVGFIAVFGVAVLNGLVLITYINQLRGSGKLLRDAVREGAETRLRPVLMTALVASFGFLPMALSTSAGAEVQRPLATVVIGGLLSSTLLTLLLLPTLYSWLEGRIERRRSETSGTLEPARANAQ